MLCIFFATIQLLKQKYNILSAAAILLDVKRGACIQESKLSVGQLKELKRNRKERKKERKLNVQDFIIHNSWNSSKEADGALDKARKHKRRRLEDTLNLFLKKRKSS
ncbi:hypothetical protein F0562_023498 [Nyssa sinensis]|uniref:Uncharacterized protein n=1 Tax=Nyssa sinensis TaxID=561372 RepID=A0A5J5BI86_9ASTE|nr:hypothetical protein F0562_023498 [Nyssa sinensis]